MKVIIISLVFLLSFNAHSQSNSGSEENLTGVLYLDSRIALQNFSGPGLLNFTPANDAKKSPVLAGLLSLVLPGAGEIYTGEYWKAAIFIALEAGLITTGLIYDKKGDDKTSDYQNYADDYWSVVRYAEWMNEFKGMSIEINPDETLQPWQRVNWQHLNAAERQIQGFSHTLPPHGDQQYYEQIGKYFQYSSGWNDYSSGENNAIISPNFSFYSVERGKANNYYNSASAAVIGIYINHFLSALDGVWSAVQFNSDLAVKIRVEGQQFAHHTEYIPTLYLSYGF
ncbi:MAG: DUF5683 domain-containing protein [Ignavibacteriaceae bacterium]